jgi:hypothetical protein
VPADVLKGAAGTLAQQRNDSPVRVVHMGVKCGTPATNQHCAVPNSSESLRGAI